MAGIELKNAGKRKIRLLIIKVNTYEVLIIFPAKLIYRLQLI